MSININNTFVIDFITGSLFESEVIRVDQYHLCFFLSKCFQTDDVKVFILGEVELELSTLVVLLVHFEVFDKRVNEGLFIYFINSLWITIDSILYLIYHILTEY